MQSPYDGPVSVIPISIGGLEVRLARPADPDRLLEDPAVLELNRREIAQFSARGLSRLDAVGRSILLLALAELKHRPDVPVKVVINEAVNLAKRYGPAESFRFVNAVTDKAAKVLRSDSAAAAG